MNAWHVQLVVCGLLGLSACGKHSPLEAKDASAPDAASLDGDNGGQVRVGDSARSRSSAATTAGDAAVAADAAPSSNEADASAGGAGRRGVPGRAGSGAGGRPGWGGFSGRPAFPTGGSGFPRRSRDRDDDDAGLIDGGAPAADGGVVSGPDANQGAAGQGAAGENAAGENAAGEGGAGEPGEAGAGGAEAAGGEGPPPVPDAGTVEEPVEQPVLDAGVLVDAGSVVDAGP